MAEAKKKRFDFSTVRIPKFTFKETQINGFLVLALVIFAFLLGMLTNKVMYLEQQINNPIPTTTAQAADPNAQAAPPAQPPVNIDAIKALFTDKHITFGDKNNKNLIVEVADPSCPYCHVAAGLNPELSAEVGPQFKTEAEGGTYVPPLPKIRELVEQGKAAFVWIYFPGHGSGEMGTKALFCAHEQGKFWEVHDKLMNNTGYDLLNNKVQNDKTKSQELVDYLANVVDTNQLKSCIDSGKYDAQLTEDTSVATSLSVNGTPGFFINTTPFTGAYSWKEMERAIK